MKSALFAVTCAIALLSACRGSTTAAPTALATPAVSTSEAQALCLAANVGNTPIDRALGAAQTALRSRATAPLWIEAGQQWLRKARISADAGFYLNVDACAEAALALVDNEPNALALRALALMNAHRFEAARRLAEDILDASPQHVVALGILSDAALELGDYPLALSAAQRQMSMRPGMAADARGSYLAFLHGDDSRAKELIRDALYNRSRSDPEAAAWTFVEAAKLYWHVGDHAGADLLLVEATNWVVDYPAALVLRARIALAQDDPEHAITHAERAHHVQPVIESAWLLSDAYRQLGNAHAANEWFARARHLGEQSDALTLSLMLATRDHDAARALATIEVERRTRGGIYIDDAYAWALYRNDRLNEAKQASDRALRLGTADARLLFHAGAIRVALDELNDGRALIEHALALNPQFDPIEADEARKLLSPLPEWERGRSEGDLSAVSQ